MDDGFLVRGVDVHQEDSTVSQRRRELLWQDAGTQPATDPLVRRTAGDGDVTRRVRSGGTIHQDAETRQHGADARRLLGPTRLRRCRRRTIQEHRVYMHLFRTYV